MNSIRDVKVRVQDFTVPQSSRPQRRIETVTESGALFLAFESLPRRNEVLSMPRLRHPRMAPAQEEQDQA